jgi:hypothetical protein
VNAALAAPPDVWVVVTGVSAAVGAVGSLIVAAAAVVGFRTLRVTQDALEVSRDTLTLSKESLADERRRKKIVVAIEINERFNREFVPLARSLWDAYSAERMAFMSTTGDAPYRVGPEIMDEGERLGNLLESWALFILNDIADESLLLRVAGRSFCQQVDHLTTFSGFTLANARVNWPAVYEIRDRWAPRLTNLLAEVAEESRKLRGLL